MSTGLGNTVRRLASIQKKPYAVRVNRETGAIYLEREYSPFYHELPYRLVMIVAILCAVVSCCGYIRVRTDMECRIRRTARLERELTVKKNDNFLMEKLMSKTPDLDQVYAIATTELGMVPVTEKHVILFESTNSEFVAQRDDIPGLHNFSK